MIISYKYLLFTKVNNIIIIIRSSNNSSSSNVKIYSSIKFEKRIIKIKKKKKILFF